MGSAETVTAALARVRAHAEGAIMAPEERADLLVAIALAEAAVAETRAEDAAADAANLLYAGPDYGMTKRRQLNAANSAVDSATAHRRALARGEG